MLHDPALRDPRGYVLPADQADFPTAVTFVNTLIRAGVTVHRVGGHSDGLQVVRVETARGPVVLASDAAHYYANLQKRSPFPIVYNVGDMAQGWETVERLAGHPDRFIPGHDPLVSEIYPRASDKVDAFALHLAPSRSFAK